MAQISPQEFLALPLRVHSILTGVALHDVWAVDLPPLRDGVTLQEFHQRVTGQDCVCRGADDGLTSDYGCISGRISLPARLLFRLRLLIGRIFGWDSEPRESELELFAQRLTAEDRARSAVPAGTPEGLFRVVYSFENETLLEVVNRTVHGALLSALAETPKGYRFYLAIYVRKLDWITPVYMAMIDPFRKWVVYPALLKQVRSNWTEAFGPSQAQR